MDLKILKNELTPKITEDNKNAQLYVTIITRNSEIVNDRQQQAMNELVKYLKRKIKFFFFPNK